MPSIWKIRPVHESVVEEIKTRFDLPDPIARVLALRGYHAEAEIDAFLKPRLAGLSDPFLLPDMHKAVARIWAAINAHETITVFGDYDVDGVTSAALLTRFLNELDADVKPFIPDRLDEGYGLSHEALERCLDEHQSTLVITVDCGVNSVESVAATQAKGVDVIVTDHHEPEEKTAPALALINPKLGTAPELHALSGVGVAFKLAHALLKFGREQKQESALQPDLRNYLDIVALGTVADMVPLTGENRALVRSGLESLNRTQWEGMKALKRVAGIRGRADTYNLGFQLGPRINAAGRIGQPMQALQLLTTNDPNEAREIAELLDQTNQERQGIERQMADQAFAEIDGYFDPARHFGLVVAQEGWHPGVVGIVASRVSRHYNRPAIVMGIDEEGKVRGSCRSIDAFDVLEGLRACDHLLLKYGGHKMAAGVELAVESLDAFKHEFNQAAGAELEQLDLSPVQHIDAAVTATELGWEFFEQLDQLQPFGQDNPEAVWMIAGVRVSGQPRVVGNNHLKLSVISEGQTFDAIAFNYPLDQLPAGKLDLAFALKENNWNGNKSLQLQIKAIRAAE